MEREVSLEYLARLLWLLAEGALRVDSYSSSPGTWQADGRARMVITLQWDQVLPCMPPSPAPGHERLVEDARQLLLLAYATLSGWKPMQTSHDPEPWEVVAQDLLALGRVREAVALVRDQAVRPPS